MLHVNFNTYNSYVTDSLYQWDINQVLSVTGLNLPVAPEIHFSNADMNKAIPRQATLLNGVVAVGIPNSLLQYPLTINAHIGIYEGDTFKVIELVQIPVIPKKKPVDYQLQDADGEIYSFKRLENMIANIIAHNNDTDGNSELVDLRTDYEGNVHASAGEAIRYQIVKLANQSGGGTIVPTSRVSEVTLLADKWEGEDSLYSQVVIIPGITDHSQVNLTPSVEQLAIFYNKDLTFVTENEDGVVTVYAIGEKPTNDYTIPVTIMEVDYE